MSAQNPFDSKDDSRSFYRRRLLRHLFVGAASSSIGSLFWIAACIYNDRKSNESFGWDNWLIYAVLLLGGCTAGMFGGGWAYLVARLKERGKRVWAGILAVAIGSAILFSPLGVAYFLGMIDPMPDSCIFGNDRYCLAFDLVNPYGQVFLAGGVSLIWGAITLCHRSKRPAPTVPPG